VGKEPVIVALTGWGQAEDKHRSQEAGFDHHLVKPIEPAVLQRFLAEIPNRKPPDGWSAMNPSTRRDADAIRYIVLQLASGLRHTLMGELQSIQFLAELGARRMEDSGNDGSRRASSSARYRWLPARPSAPAIR
jgi:CheY-like chemotaxis protein